MRDCAALGRGFRMPLMFHVKHRPHTMRLKSYSLAANALASLDK
uniref:Uncharacterized protein n=1 Tax=Siphoviridae sp. ctnPP24 TaxID=2825662 RepID=A0A8S5TZ92_9CAUD|nr:MAG TPA: hypothetical protein [Siphoviridae sp. ctnPP24]